MGKEPGVKRRHSDVHAGVLNQCQISTPDFKKIVIICKYISVLECFKRRFVFKSQLSSRPTDGGGNNVLVQQQH